jgi:hypothetical protein
MEKLGLIGIPGFVVKLRSFATALLHGIRNMPDDANAAEAWMLTLADQTLVMTKNGANRLGFAVLLLFYRANGRFPKKAIEIDDGTLERVARQLGAELDDRDWYDTTSRTWKRHRAEIRAWLGFREATVADAELLEAWLRDRVPAVGVVPDQLAALLETRCRELWIEPHRIVSIGSPVPRSTLMIVVSVTASWAALSQGHESAWKRCCVPPGMSPTVRCPIRLRNQPPHCFCGCAAIQADRGWRASRTNWPSWS